MRRLGAVIAILVVALAGCAASRGPAYEHPAAIAIQMLLELRADDVRDAEAYVPYFLESSLATAMAEGSQEPTGTPRVPDWNPPYVSEETSTTASVVVVWKADADFPDWPLVNVFSLSLNEGDWVVVDAVEATAAPAPIVADTNSGDER